MEPDLSIEELTQLEIEMNKNIITELENRKKGALSRADIEEIEDDLQIAKDRLFFAKMYAHLD